MTAKVDSRERWVVKQCLTDTTEFNKRLRTALERFSEVAVYTSLLKTNLQKQDFEKYIFQWQSI